MRPIRFRTRLLLVLLSSALFAFSFPNAWDKSLDPSTDFFAWFALVPLLVALEGASPTAAALLGFGWGFVSFGALQYWVLFLAEAKYLAAPAWAALNAVLALHYLAWAAAYVFLRKRYPRSGPMLAPVTWVALEYLRTVPPVVGYPSGLIGSSQAGVGLMLPLVSFAGVWGLSFLLVWVNAAIAEGLREGGTPARWPRRTQAAVALPVAVALLAVFLGGAVLKGTRQREVGTVAIVQPAIDQSAKWTRAQERRTYDDLERLTREAARTRPSLILWPETAVPAYLNLNAEAMRRVTAAVRSAKTPLLTGCLDAARESPGKVSLYNAAVHFSGNGIPAPAYRKRHLVPFGEYVPAQEFFSFLGPVVSELGSFDAGEAYRVFPARGFAYSPLICFETEFPHEVRKALAGADALVNVSNDAWYSDTAAAWQHALLAALRSAENGKPLLRCANTGISLVTDARGRVIASTPLEKRTVLTAPVLVREGPPTFYARFGDWLPVLCLVLAVVALAAGAFPQRPRTAVWAVLLSFLVVSAGCRPAPARPELIFGLEGKLDGWLNQPQDVAADREGNFYVADYANHRVQKFDRRGRWLATWGGFGREERRFNYPKTIEVAPDGRVYVGEQNNARIQVFDDQGRWLAGWGGPGEAPGRFRDSLDLSLAPDARVYAADTHHSRIQYFEPTGKLIGVFGRAGDGEGEFASPFGLCVAGDGTVFVSDTFHNRIQAFTSDGRWLRAWGREGAGPGELQHPQKMAVAPDGNLWVADTYNNRLQCFKPDGTLVRTLGRLGNRPGEFNTPFGVAFDREGRLLVADTWNHRIQVFRRFH